MIIMRTLEDQLIDSYRPQTDYVSNVTVMADNPGQDSMAVGGVTIPELPSASIGGQNASKNQNGYSAGFKSMRQRIQPFLGAMAKPPAIQNGVQGQVGNTNRAGKLHAGVMNQLVQYTPSQIAYVASYVGNVKPTVIATTGK
jgi:hypothetical protein